METRLHQTTVVKLLRARERLQLELKEVNRMLRLLDSDTPLTSEKANKRLHWTKDPARHADVKRALTLAQAARQKKAFDGAVALQQLERKEGITLS